VLFTESNKRADSGKQERNAEKTQQPEKCTKHRDLYHELQQFEEFGK